MSGKMFLTLLFQTLPGALALAFRSQTMPVLSALVSESAAGLLGDAGSWRSVCF